LQVASVNKFQWVQAYNLTRRSIKADKGVRGEKEVKFTTLSGKIPEQRLVQK